jgi:hypothetical protein
MMGTAHTAPVMSIPDQPKLLVHKRADTKHSPVLLRHEEQQLICQAHIAWYRSSTLCDATTRGLMCASHLHWAPCENMKSSHHLNRASWEAQWRDHNCFVSKETQLTERIAYPKPGWAARRRAYKPADPERESKSERSTLPTPFISHTYTLEPRAQPCGSSLRVASEETLSHAEPGCEPSPAASSSSHRASA